MKLRCECGETFDEGAESCPSCDRAAGFATPVERAPGRRPVRRFLDATFGALFQPTEFFRSLPPSGGYLRPMLHGTLVTWIGFVFGIFLPILVQGRPVDLLFAMMSLFIFYPLLVVAGLFVWAAILHLSGSITGCADGGFISTFRASAYACAGLLLVIIPLLGPYVAPIWWLVVQVIGLRVLHKSTARRAALTVILAVLGLAAGPLFLAGYA